MTSLSQRDSLAGLGTLIPFTLRYNRVRLLIWILLTAGMVAFIGAYYKSLDPEALQDLILAGATDSMKSLLGWISVAVPGEAPLGAAVWIKSWMFVGLMLCIGMIFLVTHNLRADEDTGRTELFRSRVLGVHSSMASTLIMTVTLVLVSGTSIGAIGIAQQYGAILGGDASMDPDPLGSWVFGASIAALGLLGVGIGVLANELMPSAGAANGLGAAIIGVFYLIRMGADVQEDSSLGWFSPIGWAELMDPWGENRLWPLGCVIALAVVLIAVAWVIGTKRDYGGSLFASRLGRDSAGRWMTSVTGLAVRLQRVAWIAWALGVIVFALMLGSITPMMAEMFESMSWGGVNLSLGMLSVVGFLIAMLSLGVSSFAVYSTSTIVLDDTHGLLEYQLSGSISRISWALKRLAVSFAATLLLLLLFSAVYAVSYCAGMDDFSDFGKITATVFAYIPSVLILMGVVVLGFGWWPRLAVAIGWGFFGAIWFIMILGEALRLPDEALQALPFISMAGLPAESVNWVNLLVTLGVAALMVVVGLIGFRRRNVPA